MTAARSGWILGLGLAALAGGCGGPTNDDFARDEYDALVGKSMTDVMRAGIVPTGFTATNATTRLYVAQGSNVVRTLGGPMVAYVPCNLTIEATDPTGVSGSDASSCAGSTSRGHAGERPACLGHTHTTVCEADRENKHRVGPLAELFKRVTSK